MCAQRLAPCNRRRPLLAALGLAMAWPARAATPAPASRAAQARAEAKAMLLDPRKAFLAREALVIRDEALLEPALDEVMRSVEFWLAGDADRLRQQLELQTDTVRLALLRSEAGMAALARQALAAHATPQLNRRDITTPGAPANAFERRLSEVAGIVLSGRPAVARDRPPSHVVQVEADHGLLPAPLEANSRAKGYTTPLRYRADHGGWLDPTQPDRPSPAVLARSVLALIRQHPDATHLVLRYTLLRRMGAPVHWQYLAEPAADGSAIVLQGAGRAPGFDARVGPLRLAAPQLHGLADQAPSLSNAGLSAKP